MGERRTLGDILVSLGRVTEDDVATALAFQREHGGYFGEALLACGLLTRDELEWGLASQFDLPYVFPDADAIDPRAFLFEMLGREIDCEIVVANAWRPRLSLAERYGEGRVWLAGDAAHQVIPTGDYAMNTGEPLLERADSGIRDIDAGEVRQLFAVHRGRTLDDGPAATGDIDNAGVRAPYPGRLEERIPERQHSRMTGAAGGIVSFGCA